MKQSNFQIAFSVSVYHTYFEQSICNCLCFAPGPVTQVLLKRFDLKLQNSVNGFGLYVNCRTTLDNFLAYAGKTTGNTFFDLEIISTAPSFNLFTELPVNQLNQLVYDSSSSSNTIAGGVTQLTAGMLTATHPGVIGMLKIHFDDLLKGGSNGHAQFAINYTARATQWQYYVINKSIVQLHDPTITSKTSISFDGPQTVITENGQQAMLFTSGNNLIPLSAVPKYKFDLVSSPANKSGQGLSSAKMIFKGLPTPDPTRIGIDAAGSRVVSPMYVYV